MEMALGEGPLWHSQRSSWCWFDILRQNLYELEYGDFAEAMLIKHELPVIATAMAVVDLYSIIMATDKGIGHYNLVTRNFKLLSPLRLGRGIRTNEGGMGPDGRFWFSSMEKSHRG